MARFYLLLSVSKLETNVAQNTTKTWAEWVQKQTGIQLTGTYSYHRIDALFKSKGLLFSNNEEEEQLRQEQIECCFKQNLSPMAIISLFQFNKKNGLTFIKPINNLSIYPIALVQNLYENLRPFEARLYEQCRFFSIPRSINLAQIQSLISQPKDPADDANRARLKHK
ncbi:hypothetical protein [Legionella sp. km772]|uniref:hypothetical protein n=1 Tax=Legionella sp. km772 TaxID=2498111 RepID=UPI000FA5FB43|nr:hypothetical protein [Legionella sp. km772]RUR10246.1 hypothetical protein ELY15_08360 [Legionella sp. km772]